MRTSQIIAERVPMCGVGGQHGSQIQVGEHNDGRRHRYPPPAHTRRSISALPSFAKRLRMAHCPAAYAALPANVHTKFRRKVAMAGTGTF
jgi:hypothetical protein